MLRRIKLSLASIFICFLVLGFVANLLAYNMGIYDPLPYNSTYIYTEGNYKNGTWTWYNTRQNINILVPDDCVQLPDERKIKHTQTGQGGQGHYLNDYLQKPGNGARTETRWRLLNPLTDWSAWGESVTSWQAHGGWPPYKQPFIWYFYEMQAGRYWTGFEFHDWNGSWSPPVDWDDYFFSGYATSCSESFTGAGSWMFSYHWADPVLYTINAFNETFYNVLRVYERQWYWDPNTQQWVPVTGTHVSRYYAPNLGLIYLYNHDVNETGGNDVWLYGNMPS